MKTRAWCSQRTCPLWFCDLTILYRLISFFFLREETWFFPLALIPVVAFAWYTKRHIERKVVSDISTSYHKMVSFEQVSQSRYHFLVFMCFKQENTCQCHLRLLNIFTLWSHNIFWNSFLMMLWSLLLLFKKTVLLFDLENEIW